MPQRKRAQPKAKVDNEKNEYIMVVEVAVTGEVISWNRYETLEALQRDLDDIYKEYYYLADLDDLEITLFKGSLVPITLESQPIQVTVPGGKLTIPAKLVNCHWISE